MAAYIIKKKSWDMQAPKTQNISQLFLCWFSKNVPFFVDYPLSGAKFRYQSRSLYNQGLKMQFSAKISISKMSELAYFVIAVSYWAEKEKAWK
ncbi:MAG: hypothetical protein LBU32_06695 [Clostridiales bacterium]|nr:hypothetical protein [Clostridiales bacterium]